MTTPTTLAGTVRHEIVLPGRIEPHELELTAGVLTAPAPGRVLLQLEATGVCFAEQQMRRGKYYDQPAFPFVPGYDLVGTVEATGSGVDADLLGRRVAAVTKTGAWASHVEVDAGALLPVPTELDAAEVETLIVNGITAWQMLHDVAEVGPGATVVVLGANGGVGSTLVQIARAAGIHVIGTAAVRHHDLLRDLGAEPVDSADAAVHARIRELAPDGVQAVFDHVGGAGITRSWDLLARGGTLVSYGTASTKDSEGNSQLPVLRVYARILAWNVLPNGKRARFYNFWAGRRRPVRFHTRQRASFSEVLALLATGAIRPQIAARFALADTGSALALAESRTVAGKVVILPN